MKISLTNAKLGDKIPSLNLPAVKTCRADAPCRNGCYATKGAYTYPKVKESLENNLKDYLANGDKFFNDIIEYLNNGDITFKFFRWFSSGDLVDYKFWLGVVKVAIECSSTKFLLFTKKFNLVNMWLALGNKLPDNLRVVFSGWDENFTIDNPFNLPTTYVYFKGKENKHIPEFAINCVGSCKSCKACWTLKNGQSVYFNKH